MQFLGEHGPYNEHEDRRDRDLPTGDDDIEGEAKRCQLVTELIAYGSN